MVVRRVIFEAQHLLRVLVTVETLRAGIDAAWETEVYVLFVVFYKLRCPLQDGGSGMGALSGSVWPATAPVEGSNS